MKYILFALLLFTPFLFVIIVNEYVRSNQKETYYKGNYSVLNSSEFIKNRCTWVCHDNTFYCKKYHLGFSDKTLAITDPYYFGTIQFLKSTGNYKLANVIIYTLIMPLWIYFFLILCLNQIFKIKKMRTNVRI